MTIATKPSVGAMKAAKLIAVNDRIKMLTAGTILRSDFAADIAPIISAETHDSELLEALQDATEALSQMTEHLEGQHDMAEDSTETLLEAFDDCGYGNIHSEICRLVANGRRYTTEAKAVLLKAKEGR